MIPRSTATNQPGRDQCTQANLMSWFLINGCARVNANVAVDMKANALKRSKFLFHLRATLDEKPPNRGTMFLMGPVLAEPHLPTYIPQYKTILKKHLRPKFFLSKFLKRYFINGLIC